MTENNVIQPFLIDAGMSRGQAVRLTSVLDTMINQHQYPEQIGKLLAEAAVLTAMLASSVKYDGVFTLQIQGKGAVTGLVVSLTTSGQMRGYVHFDDAMLQKLDSIKQKNITDYFGKGTLAFTAEQAGQTYQGIIALDKETLTDCVLSYFEQSEQIDTQIKVAIVPPEKEHGWIAGAVLLQKMPFDSKLTEQLGTDQLNELWQTSVILLKSLTDSEMTDLSLDLEKMLYRLFHQNDLHYFPKKSFNFGCHCSKEKVLNMLKTFSKQDLDEMTVDGKISIDCQFCGKSYTITPSELGA
ncbi:MAG: Hsp33 family molecular chaperone HslO [Alphaproteobacteria bacterium]|nr:Hsp33 family molecular chaperone HslO [Alphaproteobacteria bacterium]